MISQTVCPHCGAANRVAAGHDVRAGKCGRCAGSLGLCEPTEVDDAALARNLELRAISPQHIRAP
jgi:thioredoxin 2